MLLTGGNYLSRELRKSVGTAAQSLVVKLRDLVTPDPQSYARLYSSISISVHEVK